MSYSCHKGYLITFEDYESDKGDMRHKICLSKRLFYKSWGDVMKDNDMYKEIVNIYSRCCPYKITSIVQILEPITKKENGYFSTTDILIYKGNFECNLESCKNKPSDFCPYNTDIKWLYETGHIYNYDSQNRPLDLF